MTASVSSPARRNIEVPSGRISYLEQGRGPVALFVHGVLLIAIEGHAFHLLENLREVHG